MIVERGSLWGELNCSSSDRARGESGEQENRAVPSEQKRRTEFDKKSPRHSSAFGGVSVLPGMEEPFL